MAWEGHKVIVSKQSAADYSAGTSKYKFVEIATTGKVTVCDGATDVPFGVLQNSPATDELAEVCIFGVTKVQADADLAVGDLIGTSADGQADAKTAGTDTTEYVVGVVVENTSAAGDYTTCHINCLNPHRGA